MRLLSAAVLAAFVLAPLAPEAQVALDLTLGPVVAFSEDVSGFQFDPDDPDATPVQQFDAVPVPTSVGFEAGLGVIVMPGPVGVRVGAHFLNTSAVFDGEQTFNRESLDANFLTLQLDLRTGADLGPLRAYAFGGPEFRYLLDLSGEDLTVASVREDARLLSTAATFGAGLTFDFAGTRFGPKVSYSIDLSGVEGDDIVLDNGNVLRLDEAYDLDTLLFGIVFGGR